MPLIKVNSSVRCEAAKKEEVVKELSKITAEVIGKPETYVASVFEDDAVISYGGEIGPGAFVEVRSIGGIGGQVNKDLSAKISACLKEKLGIDSSKIYINFYDVSGSDWGWNGSTFG